MDADASRPLLARRLEFPCELAAAAQARAQACAALAADGVAPDEVSRLELALAEGANNAVFYVRETARPLPVRIETLVSPAWVEIRITDHTPGFDFPAHATLPPEDAESGRGLFLIQNLVDEARYLRGDAENCLILRLRRAASASPPPAVPPGDPAEKLRETERTLELMTEELSSCYESLSAVFRFSSELQADDASASFVQRWLDQLLRITDADWFILRLASPDGSELRTAATSHAGGLPEPVALAAASSPRASAEAAAAATRKDFWFDASTPLAHDDPLHRPAGTGCGLAHPMFVNDTLVGVLTVGRLPARPAFQTGQSSVIQTVADFLALQIRNAQLHEEQLAARLNLRDLEIAANIQRMLLPEQLPSAPRASLAGFYRSAREIGGDYYDALPTPDGGLLLVVADVMGKGLPAALFAFMFRSLVRARRDLAPQPSEFLAWLNQNLFHELDRAEMFITAQLAFWDGPRGELRVAGAGHPPLLAAGADGHVREIASGGPPLGIHAAAEFPGESVACPDGHALMFTDGLIEARNARSELLGLDAVKAVLAAAARNRDSGESAKQRLIDLLRGFELETAPADDTAFLVLSRTEAGDHA